MVLSILVAIILTPALCATILKPVTPGTSHNKGGFFGWFNRLFNKFTHHYTDSVDHMLVKTGRYMAIYLLVVVGMGVLFIQLPTGFIPEEDQVLR